MLNTKSKSHKLRPNIIGLAVLLWFNILTVANAGIVYSVDRVIGVNSIGGDGHVMGTIHTDGKQGVLSSDNIYGFDLTFRARGTEVSFNGDCSDSTILCYVSGARLTAHSGFLLFDFRPSPVEGVMRLSGGDESGALDYGIWELGPTTNDRYVELVDAKSGSNIFYRNGEIRDRLIVVGYSLSEPTSAALVGLALAAVGVNHWRRTSRGKNKCSKNRPQYPGTVGG